ncbi:MAG: beta-propeller domain-containing protein [Thermoplasmatota archaeon]
MAASDIREQDRSSGRTIGKNLIIFAAVALVVVPTAALILFLASDSDDDDFTYTGDVSGVTGDSSMDESTRNRWTEYLKTAPTLDIENLKIKSEWSGEKDLELLDSIDEPYLSNVSSPPEYQGDDKQDAAGSGDEMDAVADEDAERDDGGEKENREVEESDIVKNIGDRLFILNPTMGLIVVNLEDPSDPFIEGRIFLYGNPVSMYVVDFLGFVIVSNYPSGEQYDYGTTDGMLYIVDLTDMTAPRVVDMVEITGTPLDSRRVGDVIYVISNSYPYSVWWGMEDDVILEADDVVGSDDKDPSSEEETIFTEITSIAFNDPENIGEIDREVFPGTSSHIHVSQIAVFIAKTSGWLWSGSNPETEVTYVDISDPKGDIKIRGDTTVTGYLADRYQMDHYQGSFRIVTQEWAEPLPISTLRVVDCRDPDRMSEIGSLKIDDAGSLMATRFAGDRAYTIHLPYSVDPLDVIDLSDPRNPKLTYVLEIPGWIEHMEVRDYKIIALGVDDTEGQWKVALSLFDVEDPYNAVLEDRIVIGEGYTYSEANWDPKALTILDDQGLVMIPYSSYDWERYTGEENGVKIVSFDLDEGDLEARGTVTDEGQIRRTRSVNGNLVTVSDRFIQSVDIEDPDNPVVEAVIELAVNIADGFIIDGKAVSLIQPYWRDGNARIRVSDPDSIFDPYLEIGPEGLEYEGIQRVGSRVFIKGIRQGADDEAPVWEVHMYDMSDPLEPVHYEPVQLSLPPEVYTRYIYGEKVREEADPDDREETEPGSDEKEEPVLVEEEIILRAYYDPTSWWTLGDGTVITYQPYYYWYDYGDYNVHNDNLTVIRWDAPSESSVSNIPTAGTGYISRVFGDDDGFMITSSDWRGPMTIIRTVDLIDGEYIVSDGIGVVGEVIGTSSNLSLVYTQYYWYEMTDDYYYGESHNVINTYLLKDGGSVLLQSIEIDSGLSIASVSDDHIILTSGYYYYPYYGGYAVDVRMDAEEVVYDEGSVDTSESSGGGASDTTEKDEAPPEDGDDGSADEEPEETWVPTTEIHVLELDNGVPRNIETLAIDGYFHLRLSGPGIMLLQNGYTVVGYDLNGDGGAEELGPFTIPGYIRGGEATDEGAFLALGLWGTARIEY